MHRKTSEPTGLYKDAAPEPAIQKIRDTPISNGTFTTELNRSSNPNRFVSCTVQETGTKYGAHGNGLSERYCLASGYGEFIGRLQNHCAGEVALRCV